MNEWINGWWAWRVSAANSHEGGFTHDLN
jgi:hypothetical protein